MKQTLTEKLESLNTATPETLVLLKNLFVPVSFRKGILFHWHEQASHVLYFIETGLVRGYIFYNGEEYTCWVLEKRIFAAGKSGSSYCGNRVYRVYGGNQWMVFESG